MTKPARTISTASAALALLCLILLPLSAGSRERASAPDDALQALEAGNARFVQGQLLHPRQDAARREAVAAKQRPIATVVACADSRVPPELLFDQGLGDLFVVRVAGNVLDDAAIGSVEYAAEHFGVPLVVVLGHNRCGAVTAAVKGGEAPGKIGSIVELLEPSVEEARKHSASDLVEAAAHLNVERGVKTLAASDPILSPLVRKGKVKVVGAYYDLDSGKVELLPQPR